MDEDIVGYCEGHTIEREDACPLDDESCRWHCGHPHAAEEAGQQAAQHQRERWERLKDGQFYIRVSAEAHALGWLQQQHQEDIRAFAAAFRQAEEEQ